VGLCAGALLNGRRTKDIITTNGKIQS
jgi:hypothetical protein